MTKWCESRAILCAVILFVTTFVVHDLSPVATNYDSKWAIAMTVSILREHNTDLDEYQSQFNLPDYEIENINNHFYYYFPIGSSLVALPFVWAVQHFAHPFDFYSHVLQSSNDQIVAALEKFIAAFLVALTSVVIYFIARQYSDVVQSLSIAFIYAFCTSAWSTASRSLWQHGPSMLMLSIALYFLVRSEKTPKLAQYASIALAAAYIIRPTNSISIIVFSAWVFFRHRQWFLRYCLWGILIAIPFVLYNWSIYGRLLSPYYQPSRLATSPFFLQALVGNLVSPARGLFVWTPILLFIFWGIWFGRSRSLTVTAALIILFHWLTISSFAHWYGGWSVGPRLFTDIMPYAVLLLMPVVQRWFVFSNKVNWLGISSFSIAALASFLIHGHAATDQNVVDWNRLPINIDVNPGRIWSWPDLPFLRGTGSARFEVNPEIIHPDEVDHHDSTNLLSKFSITNTSHRNIDLEVVAPFGVSLASLYRLQAVEHSDTYSRYRTSIPLEVGETFTIEVNIYLPVIQSGNLEPVSLWVEATNADGYSSGPTIEVIPIQTIDSQSFSKRLLSLEDDAPRKVTASSKAGNNEVYTYYGSGWYPVEISGNITWRWAMSPASLYVYSEGKQRMSLQSDVVAWVSQGGHAGEKDKVELAISVNGKTPANEIVQVAEPFVTYISLDAGWNNVQLSSSDGNFRLSDIDVNSQDQRFLSFALSPIQINAR